MSSVQSIIDAATTRVSDAITQANTYVDIFENIASESNWEAPAKVSYDDLKDYLAVNRDSDLTLEKGLDQDEAGRTLKTYDLKVSDNLDKNNAKIYDLKVSDNLDKDNAKIYDLKKSDNLDKNNAKIYDLKVSDNLDKDNQKIYDLKKSDNLDKDNQKIYDLKKSDNLDKDNAKIYDLKKSDNLDKDNQKIYDLNKFVDIDLKDEDKVKSVSVDEPSDIPKSNPIATTVVNNFTLSTVDLSNVSTVRSTGATFVESKMPESVSSTPIIPSNVSAITQTIQDISLPPLPTLATLTPPTGDVKLDDVTVTLSAAPVAVNNAVLTFSAIADPSVINVESYLIPNPTADYSVPSSQFTFVERDYSSAFKDSLLDALLKEMTVGATGINPDDELLLFQRGRDREAATYKDSSQQIARQMAARGFKIPPSAMMGLMNKAQDAMHKAMSGINRDIMLKRADLYVQARQFAIQQGVQLETAMLNYHGAMMERAMNAAKLVADFGISYHNLQVQKFKDSLEVWKTVSDVRSQWVDNAIKATKTYELKLEKLKLEGEQNNQRIQLQDSMNRAVDLANNIRKTELEIAGFKLENNKLRIEQSKLLTQNYAESMRGNMIAFQAYSEAVKAQTLKNEPIRLAIDLHREQRETVLSEFNMKAQAEELKLKTLEANLNRSNQLLQKYYKELDVEVEMVSEKSKRLGIELEAWKAKMDIEKVNNELTIEVGKINNQNSLEAKKATAQFKFEASKLNAQLETDVSKMNAQLKFDETRINKEKALEIDKANKQIAFEIDKLNKDKAFEIDKVNKQTTLRIDEINKERNFEIDKLNKEKSFEIDKLNKTITLDVDKTNKQTSLKIDELNKQTNLKIDELNKQTNLKIDEINKERNFEIDKLNKSTSLDVDKTNKQIALEVDKLNKQTNLKIDEINKERNFEIDKVNKQTSLKIDEINKERNFEIDKVNKEKSFEVDKLNKQIAFDVDKANKTITFDVDKANKQIALEVDKVNKQTSLKIDEINKQTSLKIDEINKEKTLEVDRINKQTTLEIDKANQTLRFEIDKFNKEVQIDSQYKTGTLFIEGIKENNRAQHDSEMTRINDDQVAVSAAKAGADVMMSIISSAQASLGAIATLSE